MAEETLLTAARRAVRFFNIDESKGGLTTEDTLIAMLTLDKQVRAEDERQKALSRYDAEGNLIEYAGVSIRHVDRLDETKADA